MTVLAVVLAAGGSTRFEAPDGSSKLVARLGPRAGDPPGSRGPTLVRRCIEVAVEAGIGEVAVVQGATRLDDEVRDGVTVLDGVAVLDNPRWSEGISTSVQTALAHARARGHDALVVGLGDQPGVVPAAWRAVARAPATRPVAVAVYASGRGNPVRLPASVWDLLPVTGDEGARVLMREHPGLVQEVPCDGDPRDIDTVADLEGW